MMSNARGRIVIAGAGVVVAGVLVYHFVSSAKLRGDVRSVEARERLLLREVDQLGRERDSAASKVASARKEMSLSQRDMEELLSLRREVAEWRSWKAGRKLMGAGTEDTNRSAEAAARSLARVNSLKEGLEQWPDKKIPELKLLSDQDWVNAVGTNDIATETDFRKAANELRRLAKRKFALDLRQGLDQYAAANDGNLPTNLVQLTPYLDPPLEDAVFDRYMISAVGKLRDVIPPLPIIVETWPVDEEYDTSFLIRPDQTDEAQPAPGSKFTVFKDRPR